MIVAPIVLKDSCYEMWYFHFPWHILAEACSVMIKEMSYLSPSGTAMPVDQRRMTISESHNIPLLRSRAVPENIGYWSGRK